LCWAGSSLMKENINAADFYRMDALPIAQPRASKHRKNSPYTIVNKTFRKLLPFYYIKLQCL